MSCTVEQLRRFLDELPPDTELAIDDGGLALVSVPDERFYYEVGGVPLEDTQPFGPDWVTSKTEENERGFGRKS